MKHTLSGRRIWFKWRFQIPYQVNQNYVACWVKLQLWEVGQSCQSLSSYPSSIGSQLLRYLFIFQPLWMNSTDFGLWESLLPVVGSISRWTSLETPPLQRFLSQVSICKVASHLFATNHIFGETFLDTKLSKAERGGFELVGRVQKTCGRDTFCCCIRPLRS